MKYFFDTTLYAEIKKYIESKLNNKFCVNLNLYEVDGENIFTIYMDNDINLKIIFSKDIILLNHKSELDAACDYLRNRIELLTF